MRRLLALLLAFGALPVSAARASDGETRIIVGRDPGLSAGERADIRDDAGVSLVKTLHVANTEVVQTSDPKAALAELRGNPDVRYAEVDHIRHALTDDPYFGTQWALDNTGTNLADYQDQGAPSGTAHADMHVPDAWATSTGETSTGARETVAVVDTVVDTTHPDLQGQIAGSANFVAAANETTTCGAATGASDHGTHVTGIIAAAAGNHAGIAGVAPQAQVLAVRALNDNGCGRDSDILNALAYAADHARIVNASLGGPGDGAAFAAVFAAHPGTLFVVAAGNGSADNDNPSTASYPCAVSPADIRAAGGSVDNVVCVGASTPTDGIAGFSNFGATSVDLFAPGEWIASTVPGGGYAFMDGTSQASPQVAGEAALVLATAPSLTTTQLKNALLASADAKPTFACRSVTGGRANAAAAVALAATPPASVAPGACNDPDHDEIDSAVDRCATQAGPASNGGCPLPVSSPTPSPTSTAAPTPSAPKPVVDTDHDGRPDSTDACPTEPAATPNGCPLPRLRALRVSVARHRRVSARVRADRVATISVRIGRRTCRAHHRCRYHRVAAKTASGRRTTLARRLPHGRYRVTVRLTSAAGHGATARRTVRVR